MKCRTSHDYRFMSQNGCSSTYISGKLEGFVERGGYRDENVVGVFLWTRDFVTLNLTLEGQLDPEDLLIDGSAWAWGSFCVHGRPASSYHFALNLRNHSAVMNEEEAGGVQEQGWQSFMSQQNTAGQGQRNGLRLVKPRGRRGLINGSCFGPTTQLADLTKCSVSPQPLFSWLGAMFVVNLNVEHKKKKKEEGTFMWSNLKVKEVI